MSRNLAHLKRLARAVRRNKRNIFVKIAVVGAVIVVSLVILFLFHVPFGVDKLVEMAINALGEGVADAVSED